MKIGVVTPIPTPYRDPFWNHVAGLQDIDLHVFYCASGKADRPWATNWRREYHLETLPGKNLLGWRGVDCSCYWNPLIVDRLRQGNFDAIVIGGYNHPTMLAAIRWAIKSHCPYFLVCESHLLNARSGWRQRWKQSLVEWAVGNAAGCLPTGQLAEQYLRHYGANPETICRLPNVPDMQKIGDEVDALRSKRSELRAAAGLTEHPIILFVGRLIKKKRADVLLKAFTTADIDKNTQLIIIGDGPQRNALQRQAANLGLNRQIRFPGFVEPCDINRWYALSDLFVLPSSETWGVVVFEAIAAGLPVIVSNEVGCHPDAVTDTCLGQITDVDDVNGLSKAIAHWLNPSTSCAKKNVLEIVLRSMSHDSIARKFVAWTQQRLDHSNKPQPPNELTSII